MIKKEVFIMNFKIIALMFIIFLTPVSLALSDEAIEVAGQIDVAEQNMYELIRAGFSVVRYNDTLYLAKEFYNMQIELEKNNETPNYLLVIDRLRELERIQRNVYEAYDELMALEAYVNSVEVSNRTPIDEKFFAAKNAFRAERYEEAMIHIDLTYKIMSEVEASDTKLRAYYDATSRGIKRFLDENWKTMAMLFIYIIIVFIIIHKPLAIFIIKHKIKMLEIRAISIQKLMAETQKEYFESGNLNESMYRIRTKKYAELLRSIHSQIPMLKERLAIERKLLKKKGDTDGTNKK
jgi:hypothetical protein